MKIRDRIKSLQRVKASELLPNPANWREHPESQADAMRGLLSEIGFADATLARETPDGLMLIDGHLRAEVAPDSEIPVLVLDVTADEADRILATHDPIAEMATANAEKLGDLLEGMEWQSPGVQSMLDELAESSGAIPPSFDAVGADEQSRLDEKAKVCCSSCNYEFTP